MAHAVYYALLALAYLAHAAPVGTPHLLHVFAPWVCVLCYAGLAWHALRRCPQWRRIARGARRPAVNPPPDQAKSN